MPAGSRRSYEGKGSKMEVIFVGAGAPFEVRMVDNQADTIIRAAETLKARYAVLVDEWSAEQNCPIWSVFDMKGCSKMHGQYVFPMATKSFTAETSDGAVMWAAAMVGKA